MTKYIVAIDNVRQSQYDYLSLAICEHIAINNSLLRSGYTLVSDALDDTQTVWAKDGQTIIVKTITE